MGLNEKILISIRSALTHLDNSVSALNKNDVSSFTDSLWHLTAELEYSLFLLSMTFQNEDEVPKWESKSGSRKVEVGSILNEASILLSEVEKYVVNEKLQDAYKNVYIARNHVLKVQDNLAKMKRGALKKK